MHSTATPHPGKRVDLSVLDIQNGDCAIYDVLGDSRNAVTLVMAVKKGQVFEAAWGPGPGLGTGQRVGRDGLETIPKTSTVPESGRPSGYLVDSMGARLF